ncbi:MAG: H(+)-transporting ATPase [Candidatus Saccharimonas sp.]|nr:ATP synthase F0 subunit C [Candidatus Saccharibacteria bacterium]RKV99866.1 MAG: H(+)-transporting ATPase [Candidatus Saccharimonas sp.]
MKDIAFTLTYAIPAGFAALGCGWIGASAMKAAGRNPEKINDLRTMMILGISFIDALAIIGFVAAIVGKVM